ncbi:MAG: chemotaxis protein CheW [Desulfobacterales bacterium]|nr:chemotaxis protein CheW [Desulfobacterales bacterium]
MVDICLPDGNAVFRLSEFDLSQSKKGARHLYLVECDLIHDVQKKGKTPLTILSDIQDIGIILESKVDIARVGTLEDEALPNGIPFIILFATIIEPDQITTLFEIHMDKIHHVTEDMMIKSLPKNEACQSKKATDQTDLAPEKQKSVPTFEPCEQRLKIGDEHLQVSKKETSLRVNVGLLDSLMVMAGELVLSRNQLLQAISSGDRQASKAVGQRIDLITTELQEAIMMTRMQSIGNIFNKFPRLVRDLSRDLGKEIELILEGEEVELDKTIIEGLSDPLTHLVRNAIDHGIEAPDARRKAGKKINGKIFLKAYHEAGQVNIEISDDGKGIDGDCLASKAVLKGAISKEQSIVMSDRERLNLIFLPGFSTAENVTEISGRGVGMDVVQNNLDKLGGQIEIDSKPGQGTKIRIKLPLTLAIIPSLLVTVGDENFAIPQINVDELLRIPYTQVKDRIEVVGNTAVVRLREELLPLIRTADVLGIDCRYIDPADQIKKPNKRHSIADRRSKKSPLIKLHYLPITESLEPLNQSERRTQMDRRSRSNSALNIVVVSTGVFKYGLVVDALHDSEEIVVKPLGRHLKNCKGYAGATILGNGHVALILDVTRFAQMAGLTSLSGKNREAQGIGAREGQNIQEIQTLLSFRNALSEHFAVPLNLVQRVEKVKASDIERIGEKRVIQYRDASLPVIFIEEVAEVSPMVPGEDVLIIVFSVAGRRLGLFAAPPIDIVEVPLIIDDTTLKQTGIMGSIVIGNRTTLFVDIYEIVEKLYPAWFEKLNQNYAHRLSD